MRRKFSEFLMLTAAFVASSSVAAQGVPERARNDHESVTVARDAVQAVGSFSVPATSVTFGQGGNAGTITARFGLQMSSVNLALDASASDQDRDGTADLLSSNGGLLAGGQLGITFTWMRSDLAPNGLVRREVFDRYCREAREEQRREAALETAVRAAQEAAVSARRGATGAGATSETNTTSPPTGVQPESGGTAPRESTDGGAVSGRVQGRSVRVEESCVDSDFRGERRQRLIREREAFLGEPWMLQARVAVNHTSLRYLDVANGLRSTSDSYTGVSAQVSLAKLISGNSIFAASFSYDAAGQAPSSRNQVCRNLPVGGMTTAPPTLQCSEIYTTGISRSRTLGLRAEFRRYLTPWLSVNPAASIAGSLVGDDSHLRIDSVSLEAPVFVRLDAGGSATLHLGVRPMLRFWAIDERPANTDATEILASVFLGGSLPMRFF